MFLLVLQAEGVLRATGELIGAVGGLGPMAVLLLVVGLLLFLPLGVSNWVQWQSNKQLANAIDNQTAVIREGYAKTGAHNEDIAEAMGEMSGHLSGVNSQLTTIKQTQEEQGRYLVRIDAKCNGRTH